MFSLSWLNRFQAGGSGSGGSSTWLSDPLPLNIWLKFYSCSSSSAKYGIQSSSIFPAPVPEPVPLPTANKTLLGEKAKKVAAASNEVFLHVDNKEMASKLKSLAAGKGIQI